eukprot:XP_011456942.2 PREDICTED: uncharacterized protein LOC105349005 [Crassostrea gigas]
MQYNWCHHLRDFYFGEAPCADDDPTSCSNVQIETAVNVSTVDWSGCTDTIPYNMTVTNSESVVLYRNSTSCCSGNLTVHYNIDNSKLNKEAGNSTLNQGALNKEPQMNTSDSSTTEQVSQISQQMVAGIIHLPDYLLLGLSGISGFLVFTTIVTIVVFSVKRRNEQKTKSKRSFCVSQEVHCNNVDSLETQNERYIVKLESPTKTLPPQNDFSFQQVDDVNTVSSNQSLASNETLYLNTCEECLEPADDIRSTSSDEATYMNTCEGYLDANDLRITTSVEAHCVRTVSSNQHVESDETNHLDTCEDYMNVSVPRPAKCGGPALDECPVLHLPWMPSNQYSDQIGEDDEHASTLAAYIELS